MPRFTVMTWNVENLFRPGPDADLTAEDAYRHKLGLLGDVLNGLAPDIVGLQEIGSPEAFEDLQQAAGGPFAHAALSSFPDRRGIRVGFLSRYPIEESEDIVDFPSGPALRIEDVGPDGEAVSVTRMGRGALRVRINPHGTSVHIVTAHLKSKLLSYPGARGGTRFQPRDEGERAQAAVAALTRRAVEAATLRIHANSLLVGNARTRLVLLGDMNDVPEAATSQILLGPPGSEIGTLGFDRPDQGDDGRLFNLAPLIPKERRYSRVTHGQGELIDHILVSAEMMPVQRDGERRLPVTVDSHVDVADRLPSMTGDPRGRAAAVVPDHAPVTASFEF